jgi:hypothetical protein
MQEIWLTNEKPARILIVEGRSAVDPDCLVAKVKDGDGKPLWIVGGDMCGKFVDCHVCGLHGVRASRASDLPWEVFEDNEAGPGWEWCIAIPGGQRIMGLREEIAYRIVGDHNARLT